MNKYLYELIIRLRVIQKRFGYKAPFIAMLISLILGLAIFDLFPRTLPFKILGMFYCLCLYNIILLKHIYEFAIKK